MRTKKNSVPILLTSSVIAQDADVTLADPELRKKLTLDSVEHWLNLDASLQIVICDGSDYDFSTDVHRRFPKASIETLHFKNELKLINYYGRGYGEGEIIKFALQHSKAIKAAQCFAKCSAKLWVDNYLECLEQWNGELACKGVFNNAFSIRKTPELDYIDTRFYICSMQFYNEKLANAHLSINRAAGIGLEQCFHNILQINNIKGMLFYIYPIIQGVGGGTGKAYKTSKTRIYKEYLKMFLIRRNNVLRELFSPAGEF